MRRGHEQVQAQGRYVCAVDDGNAYLAAGLAGLGVLWLPDYMAKPHVAGAPWCRCLLTGRWTHALARRLRTAPPRQRQAARLHRLVAALMAEHAPLQAQIAIK
jgi:DNA-binding transcriptional LysR family regulator